MGEQQVNCLFILKFGRGIGGAADRDDPRLGKTISIGRDKGRNLRHWGYVLAHQVDTTTLPRSDFPATSVLRR